MKSRIQNSVNHLIIIISSRLSTANYFRKKLLLRCLTVLQICLWVVQLFNISQNATEKNQPWRSEKDSGKDILLEFLLPSDWFTAWKISENGAFYSVSLCIQSECEKLRTRGNSLFGHFSVVFTLTLSWCRSLSYRNQSINLQKKSMSWFLYDGQLRHERVKASFDFQPYRFLCDNTELTCHCEIKGALGQSEKIILSINFCF